MADGTQKVKIDTKRNTSLDKNAIVSLLDIPIALVGGKSAEETAKPTADTVESKTSAHRFTV
jgi:hypothetical protein